MSGMRAPRAEVAVDSLGKGPEKGQEPHTCAEWTNSMDISRGREHFHSVCPEGSLWDHFKQSESGRSYFHRFFSFYPKKGGGGITLSSHRIAGDT